MSTYHSGEVCNGDRTSQRRPVDASPDSSHRRDPVGPRDGPTHARYGGLPASARTPRRGGPIAAGIGRRWRHSSEQTSRRCPTVNNHTIVKLRVDRGGACETASPGHRMLRAVPSGSVSSGDSSDGRGRVRFPSGVRRPGRRRGRRSRRQVRRSAHSNERLRYAPISGVGENRVRRN